MSADVVLVARSGWLPRRDPPVHVGLLRHPPGSGKQVQKAMTAAAAAVGRPGSGQLVACRWRLMNPCAKALLEGSCALVSGLAAVAVGLVLFPAVLLIDRLLGTVSEPWLVVSPVLMASGLATVGGCLVLRQKALPVHTAESDIAWWQADGKNG